MRTPFIAAPIPRIGQRGLDIDEQVRLLHAEIILSLYGLKRKLK